MIVFIGLFITIKYVKIYLIKTIGLFIRIKPFIYPRGKEHLLSFRFATLCIRHKLVKSSQRIILIYSVKRLLYFCPISIMSNRAL